MTCQARFHKLCTNINNNQYQEISKQNIPYMSLGCQSNTFPSCDQLNTDLSLINSGFDNFRFSGDPNILQSVTNILPILIILSL